MEVSFTPCIEVMKSRKLVPVMPSIKLISPGKYPVSFCTVPCPFQASSPPIVTEPRSGCMNPMMWRMVVDLPAPFGPRNPNTSP
ncbi:hypothetical protein D3C75_930290 [compost metagenome]